MKTKLINLYYRLSHNFWFLPALTVLFGVISSAVMLKLDRIAFETGLAVYLELLASEPEGARAVMSVIAGSMITVTGVVFSITIVALTLASSQFGPRMLSNFMKDRGNQLVLGIFISTFVYCIVILKVIRSGEDSAYVPNLSVSFGVFLAFISVCVLIYFINHAAESIQASRIISNIKSDLESKINRYQKPLDIPSGKHIDPWKSRYGIPPDFNDYSAPVFSEKSGYIQAINFDRIYSYATDNNLIIELLHKPGGYLSHSVPLVNIYPQDSLTYSVSGFINDCFITGNKRTSEQDIEFAIDQLVEIAVRSLSPGINDPFTAINSIDVLGDILLRLSRKSFPEQYRFDSNNRLRVIKKKDDFDDLADTALNQIRQNSGSTPSTTIRLLEILEMLTANITVNERKKALLKHATMIQAMAHANMAEKLDLEKVDLIYQKIVKNSGN